MRLPYRVVREMMCLAAETLSGTATLGISIISHQGTSKYSDAYVTYRITSAQVGVFPKSYGNYDYIRFGLPHILSPNSGFSKSD